MADRQGWLTLSGAFAGWALSPWRFAWHEGTRTAVVADVHLGAEVAMARQGIYLPDVSTRGILRAWEEVLKVGARQVVMAGDVFDSAAPDAGAVGLLGRLLGMLGAGGAGCEVVVTRGNHDPEEGFWREKFGEVKVVRMVRVGEVTVTHGDVMAGVDGTVMVGHQHPAVMVATRVQGAKMICYAECEVGGRGVLILPAFSPLPLGSNLLMGRNWILDMAAPLAGEVRVYGIVKERVLDFGELVGLESR